MFSEFDWLEFLLDAHRPLPSAEVGNYDLFISRVMGPVEQNFSHCFSALGIKS